jgi:hypothetical protein
MPPGTFFFSTQAGPDLLNFALDLPKQGEEVRILPLGLLPPPRAGRVASLLLEQAALQQDERTIRWLLHQYAEHVLLPDACHENGLHYHLDAVCSRLRAVAATLQAIN